MQKHSGRTLKQAGHIESLEGRTMLAATGAVYGQYYDREDFKNLSFTRNDPAIAFDWGVRAPLTRMSPTSFSVRWIGQLRAGEAGTYAFKLDADGTVALRIRGQSVALTTQTDGMRIGTIPLPANQVVDVQLDYAHLTGASRVALTWMPPGQASFGAIPPDQLINTFAPAPAAFANPIDDAGQDPWVVQWHDEYIYVWSDGGRILGSRSSRLQDIGTSPGVVLYTPPTGTQYSQQVWAPELHRLDNKWYLYFAASDGNNANHRMYVATRNADDPLAGYSFVGKLAATTDRWAIDGTVVSIASNRYFVWSGWPGSTDGEQDLYIARMSSPTTISGDRVRIAAPTLSWERNGLPINEGPEALQHGNTTQIIFSASGYWTNEYSLGQITLTGSDPMLTSSWTKTPMPVFTQGNGIVGVGHASFVKSPDQTQDWIVYHAHKFAGSFNDDRVVRMQPFTFSGDAPIFGSPVAGDWTLVEPSGTPTLYTLPSGFAFVDPNERYARRRLSIRETLIQF